VKWHASWLLRGGCSVNRRGGWPVSCYAACTPSYLTHKSPCADAAAALETWYLHDLSRRINNNPKLLQTLVLHSLGFYTKQYVVLTAAAAAAAAAMLFVICSGGWPAHMSGLLSRASCAATARQWGLQHYLQHSSSSSSSSSSSRGSGMNNGQWSTDALAEMFEGVIGALLLDSGYSTVQQLLRPWVAESFAAARAGSAAKLAAATSDDAASQQQQQQHVQGSSLVCAASSSTSSSYAQHDMAALLQAQLHQQCGYCFQDVNLLGSCSEHVLQLLSNGSSNPQADKWHFIGFSLLQFAAAQHAYVEQCQQQLTSSSMWQQLPWQQQGHAVIAAAAAGFDLSDSSTSSQASSLGSDWSSNVGSCDDGVSLSSSSSSSSSSSVNQVHLMSKQMVNLTNIRHR
jgi:hypothetical protein